MGGPFSDPSDSDSAMFSYGRPKPNAYLEHYSSIHPKLELGSSGSLLNTMPLPLIVNRGFSEEEQQKVVSKNSSTGHTSVSIDIDRAEALLHELVSQARNEPCLRSFASSSCLLLAKLNAL